MRYRKREIGNSPTSRSCSAKKWHSGKRLNAESRGIAGPEMKKAHGDYSVGFLLGSDRLILSQHQHCGAWNHALYLWPHPVDNHKILYSACMFALHYRHVWTLAAQAVRGAILA